MKSPYGSWFLCLLYNPGIHLMDQDLLVIANIIMHIIDTIILHNRRALYNQWTVSEQTYSINVIYNNIYTMSVIWAMNFQWAFSMNIIYMMSVIQSINMHNQWTLDKQ